MCRSSIVVMADLMDCRKPDAMEGYLASPICVLYYAPRPYGSGCAPRYARPKSFPTNLSASLPK
ncbi:MAG: hypothetical protein WCI11_19245 [Candidatus Methylumidiphilus sp.]